ncbi:MAG TPA: HAD hydrolase-like protein [Polyangiaceae bacterium]|jgi:phosphoglycolate phosphatase|nr:HAD hydrolase-like protein [Polyangiaceae bacterium]
MSRTHLFFDLDGTLTDSQPGILRCMRHALTEMGLEVPPDETLIRFIGPPTNDTFRELLSSSDPELNLRAISIYRERFARLGMFENSVYPGVAAGLSVLREAGFPLLVVTSKPEVYANQIIDHFELREFFGHVYGSELSGERANKGELIAHVLSSEGLSSADAWMFGDRLHDIRGAKLNGLRAGGVLWGYGSRDELTLAGADAVFADMPGLVRAFAANRGET